MLRDGLHDALLGRLLVLVDEFVDGLEVRYADLALFRVCFGLGRLAGGEQRQRKQYPSEHYAGWRGAEWRWVASHFFAASVLGDA